MELKDKDIKILTDYWNSYFSINNNIEVSNNITNVDNLFNSYLLLASNKFSYEYSDSVCFCIKNNDFYVVNYIKDNILVFKNFKFRDKRKFYNFISEFSIIITNNFPLNQNTLSKEKEILRYELIRNMFTSNHTHFFDKNLPFSINDITVFFTTTFLSLLKNNNERYNIIKFGSFLLNEFEIGVTIDEVVLKPNISISPYGRWYWHSSEKIQTDIAARKFIYKQFLKYGKIVNIDLTSGEPTILSELSGSKLLKKLVNCRMSLNNKNEIELSNIIKEVLNIFIHSVDTPAAAYSKFKYKNKNYIEIEKKLKTTIFDIFDCLQNEFLCYNNNILTEYKNNLAVTESNRRIVNPGNIIFSEFELIKEHRKYLQGLTHDRIINIAKNVYEKTQLIPIFTIHDSLSYFISNNEDSSILNKIETATKALKAPLTIEIIEMKDKVNLKK